MKARKDKLVQNPLESYRVHGENFQARSVYDAYAQRFQCPLVQAIHDRDIPLTDRDCQIEFFRVAGRRPTAEEMDQMRPDTQASVDQYWEEDDEYQEARRADEDATLDFDHSMDD